MSLAISPVACCSVEAYAISVDLCGVRGKTQLTKMACCLYVCEAVAE